VPAAQGSATLTMSAPITRAMVELTSDTRILNEPYKHILVDVQTRLQESAPAHGYHDS